MISATICKQFFCYVRNPDSGLNHRIIWTFYFQAGNKFLKSRFVSVKFDYPNPDLGFNQIFRLRLLKIRFEFEIFMKMKVNREYSWIRKFPNGTSKWIYCDTNFVTCVTLLRVTWRNLRIWTLTPSIYFFNQNHY